MGVVQARRSQSNGHAVIQHIPEWCWAMLLASTSQRDSLLSNKVVLGKSMIDLDALNTESFRRWRDFTMRCQPHFRFAHNNFFFLKSHQGVCQSMKRLGGRWWSHWKAVDGDKFVCFDSFNPNDCLVYTFGIRWIFVIVFFVILELSVMTGASKIRWRG